MKLATELSKRNTGNTIYILDEPTTGLHFEDIRVLIDVLNKLVDKGNTVIVIEHNLDVVKVADYIIDMGPEGRSRWWLHRRRRHSRSCGETRSRTYCSLPPSRIGSCAKAEK